MTRYHVQRATTGAWLDRDAPLIDGDDQSRPLSKVGSATFTIEPDQGISPTASDGRPTYEQWGTVITVEEDSGDISWRGIVTDIDWSGKTMSLTCMGVTTYPSGRVFQTVYKGVQVDPADLVRMLWAYVQSSADADLGVVVVGSTDLRVGSASTTAREEAAEAYAATVKTYNEEQAERNRIAAVRTTARKDHSATVEALRTATAAHTAAVAKKPKDQALIDSTAAARDLADDRRDAAWQKVQGLSDKVDAQAKIVDSARDVRDAAKTKLDAAKTREQNDGGAFFLHYWEAPDCGETITSVIEDNLLESMEVHRWADDEKSAVVTELQLAYPRFGRKRDDLYFEQGFNISAELKVAEAADDFAQNIFGIGAGEGAKSIRRSTGIRDGRLRRDFVLTAKDVKSAALLDARMQRRLRMHDDIAEITSVSVIGTENTPIGSWQTGDDIFLRGVLPHLGEVGIWHRITDWKRTGPDTADLTVARSDSFIYGGTTTT